MSDGDSLPLKTIYQKLLDELLNRLKEEGSRLRFNMPYIRVSDIAEQYFCEKKVEMAYLHGEVEKEARIRGRELHEELSRGLESIERERRFEKIMEGHPIWVYEMLIFAKHEGVFLVGRPDIVFFAKGLPLFIFEFKFTSYRKPFRDHHVQARTYGLILNKMGFNTDRLFYAIIISRREHKDRAWRRHVKGSIMRHGLREGIVHLIDGKAYINKFKLDKAIEEVNWAISFWKGDREAVPTKNKAKCKTCGYKDICGVNF